MEQAAASSKLHLVPGLPTDVPYLPAFCLSLVLSLLHPGGGSRSGWCEPQGQYPCDKCWAHSPSQRREDDAAGLTPKGRYPREGLEEPLPTL